jgi:hypothetical protein
MCIVMPISFEARVVLSESPRRPAGYLSGSYAWSFAQFGRPRELPAAGGWYVRRTIEGTSLQDGMGCYPLFCCARWKNLPDDFASIDNLVSLTITSDPFGEYSASDLSNWFDVVRPFKEHFVTDLSRPVDDLISRHHQKAARRAFRNVEVGIVTRPLDELPTWCGLYEGLVTRRHIVGMRVFSEQAFRHQLSTPGVVMLKAVAGPNIVGIHLWYVQNEVAYGHLGATTEEGRRLLAGYALYLYALEHFRTRVAWLDLGGGVGVRSDASNGLSAFKAGWATGTRLSYVCGRIFHRESYERLAAASGRTSQYFPAYRAGEFAA